VEEISKILEQNTLNLKEEDLSPAGKKKSILPAEIIRF
tara:strand:- start:450 stop:563 length:114 start_codon:yes stop_codon:yes gene_type:complete